MNVFHPARPLPPGPAAHAVKAWSDILALVSSTSPWSPAALTAAALAQTHGSVLTGCYIEAELRSLMGADTDQPEFALLRQHPSQCAERQAEPEFRALARRYGINRSRWEVAATGIARTLRQLAPWHDLVVMERDLAGEDRVIEVLGEALLACKVPCILLPSGPTAFRDFPRVVVAWDGSMQATRSLHAALPLLQNATKVVLLDGFVRSSDEDIVPSFDPCEYLSEHGVHVRHQVIHADARTSGSVILESARLHEADLVVMGAYGHSTLRERVLSGATRYMLRHAGLPLFMLH